MNEKYENIITRHSTKKYKSDPVPQELIEKVAEAGSYAASGMGLQSPIIIAVSDKKVRDNFSKMNAAVMGKDDGFDPFYGAPAILIVLADKNVRTHVYDGSLVMGNMMLAANALGLGSCWIHRAKEEFEADEGKAFLRSLGIDGEYEGIGHLALGYPDADTKEKPRKDNYIYYVK